MTVGEPAEVLPWDSEHFGLPIGRVVDGADPERATEWAREHGVHGLYLLAELQNAAELRAAITAGFLLTDVRLTLERSIGPEDARDGSAPLRAIEVEDLPALLDVADSAHSDSRFYADPRFDRSRVAALYREWLRASVQTPFADWAFTAVQDGEPVGYITGRQESEGVASIGLLGVSESARGRGLGVQLIERVINQAASAGCTRVTVVTQGGNIAAQRLYQRAGFRTMRAQAWFHWWAEQ